MEQMTVKDIVKATGGRLLCGDENKSLAHICIDSNQVRSGDLFVPLIGERVDAHRFLPAAIEAGAGAVLTSKDTEKDSPCPWIWVEDTKKALQAIGSYYRSRLTLPLIGITGSVGKTTTREMVAAALSAGFRVYKTPGNKNSQVGVPITLSEITKEDEIGVLELGMSLPGEMTVIAKIAQIDLAVIINVGVAHMELLGSQEKIYQEKLNIQDGLKPEGILLLNGDDPLLKTTKGREGRRTFYYGVGENCDYRATDIQLVDGYPVFTAVHGEKKVLVKLKVMGNHQVGNALAALAVADLYGVPMEKAAEKLGEFTGFKGRQQVFERSGVTVIDDTYNASPASMEAALNVLVSMKKTGQKIAVLADMRELGQEEVRYHKEIGIWLSKHPVDAILTLGELSREIEAEGTYCRHFAEGDQEGLFKEISGFVKAGDCILFKGSRSMNLDQVVKKLWQ